MSIVPKMECRYYNRGSCKYGSRCWFIHDDSIRTEFQNDSNERERRRAERERLYQLEKREREEREEREREYKIGEWIVIFNFRRKRMKHDGYCSGPENVETDSESESDEVMMDTVPSYVKSEHVKDFVVVDENIIWKLRYGRDLYSECDCCGHQYSYMRIEIRPTKDRIQRLLMATKLNENIIGLILENSEKNTIEDIGFW